MIKKPDKRTVLVIDDNLGIREILRAIFEYEGYVVHTACHGKEGLDLLRSKVNPDIILLDMMMPIMGGVEFLKILLSDNDLSSIPVYVVSASARIEDIKGARGLIRKPFDRDAIVAIVKLHCD